MVGYWPFNEIAGTIAYDKSEPKETSFSVTLITRTLSVATVTTAAVHSMDSTNMIEISGANETAYNGTFQITVTGASTFTYVVTGTPDTPATGTIVYKKNIRYNGTLAGTVGADGLIGKSLQFNGTSDNVVFTEMTVPTTAISVGFMFYRIGTPTGNTRVIDWQDSGPEDGFTFTHPTAAPTTIQFTIRNVATNVVTINSGVTANQTWYSFIGTYEVNSVKFYMNGVQQETTDTSATMTGAAATLTVAKRAVTAANYFSGRMQHLFVTNGILNQNQITKIARIALVA